MLDTLLLLSFCLLMGLVSLGVVVWVVLSGSLFYLDGLLLTFISLVIGGVFMANFVWSVRSGEFQEALNHLRKRSNKSGASSEPPPA